MSDPFELERFVEAQAGVYERVRTELRHGEKRSHWMWFIFPQLAGLGSSPMARRYAIRSLAEARAYLAHPLLGSRLAECTSLVNEHGTRAVGEIFGYPDDLKFRSAMTLFAQAAPGPEGQAYREALGRFFAGEGDPLTREHLSGACGT